MKFDFIFPWGKPGIASTASKPDNWPAVETGSARRRNETSTRQRIAANGKLANLVRPVLNQERAAGLSGTSLGCFSWNCMSVTAMTAAFIILRTLSVSETGFKTFPALPAAYENQPRRCTIRADWIDVINS